MFTILERLTQVIESRKQINGGDPQHSYAARLLATGDDAILKKIAEEAAEVLMAAKDCRAGGAPERILSECADLWFHSLILLAHFDLNPQQVLDELARREHLSGLQEKKQRPQL